MISSNFNRKLADKLKYEIESRVLARELPRLIAKRIVNDLYEKAAKISQDEILNANAEDITKYKNKLIQRFNEMEREVKRNMRKNPGKAYKSPPVTKDFDVDKWLINREAWYGTLTGDGQALTAKPLKTGGRLAARETGMAVGFDETDPEAIKWIEGNAKNSAFSITSTQYEALKKTLMEGIADGEAIQTLRKRLEESMEIARKRAEMIARTEVIKASNRGSLISYKQSGVVSGKRWMGTADRRTCAACAQMDGTKMALDKPFFEKGDTANFSDPGELFEGTLPEGGVDMKFDYEEIQHPPLHPDCRCTLIAILKKNMAINRIKSNKNFSKPIPTNGNNITSNKAGK